MTVCICQNLYRCTLKRGNCTVCKLCLNKYDAKKRKKKWDSGSSTEGCQQYGEDKPLRHYLKLRDSA